MAAVRLGELRHGTDGRIAVLFNAPPYGGDIKMGGNFSSILTQGGRPFLVVGDYGSAEF